MKLKYFSNTDTALVEFTDNEIVETREIGENIYFDLNRNCNLVSMTIEHARHNANLEGFFKKRNFPGRNLVRACE